MSGQREFLVCVEACRGSYCTLQPVFAPPKDPHCKSLGKASRSAYWRARR